MKRVRLKFLMEVVKIFNNLLLGVGAAIVTLIASEAYAKLSGADFVFAGLFVLMGVLGVVLIVLILFINKNLK